LEGWNRLIVGGLGVFLTSILLITILSLADRVTSACVLGPGQRTCFAGTYTRFFILGFEIAPVTYQVLLAWVPIITVFGAGVILAGVMTRDRKDRPPV
jgi:hypothetical protein